MVTYWYGPRPRWSSLAQPDLDAGCCTLRPAWYAAGGDQG